mmetsp:Transcript_5548/g.12094  ORF Transcript_5548/g.12094 Transcript_5548/m.12094 type:complete len:349 (-) Transcript_5548:261-1307(-)
MMMAILKLDWAGRGAPLLEDAVTPNCTGTGEVSKIAPLKVSLRCNAKPTRPLPSPPDLPSSAKPRIQLARPMFSAHLRLAEVHLGMLLHELFEHVLLGLLLARGQPSSLLPLIEHHLLDRLARVAVQVGELGVLGLHLLRVDLGVAHNHAAPPLHLVHFRQVDCEQPVVVRGVVLDRPHGVLHLDRLVELAVDDSLAALDLHLELLLHNLHVDHLRLGPLGHRDGHLQVLQSLRPAIVVADAAIVDWDRALPLAVVFGLLRVGAACCCRGRVRERVAGFGAVGGGVAGLLLGRLRRLDGRRLLGGDLLDAARFGLDFRLFLRLQTLPALLLFSLALLLLGRLLARVLS